LEKNKILKILFIILAIIPFLDILFLGLAIHYYPGGQGYDLNSNGFSFLYNTISDLGRIFAMNGEINTISRVLYSIALASMSFFTLIYYSVIWIYFQERKVTKWLSWIGTVFGIIQSGWYLALAFTPEDTLHNIHIKLIYGAASFLVAANIIYTIIYFLKRDFSKLNTYSYFVMFIAAFLLMLAVAITPVFGEQIGALPRRAGHTLFIFIVLFVYGLQGIGAYLYVKKQTKNKLDTNLPINQI